LKRVTDNFDSNKEHKNCLEKLYMVFDDNDEAIFKIYFLN